MEEPEKLRSGIEVSEALQDCLNRECAIVNALIRSVDELIAVLVGHESARRRRGETMSVPDSVAPVLTMMLQALGASSHTLSRLSNRPGLHTRDCFSIARSIIELAVNACYFIAEGPVAAERASRHARQKAYRDLARESAVGSSVIKLIFSAQPDPSVIPGLNEEIAEFTSRAGREKQSWVDASIDERIGACEKLGGSVLSKLHWARFAIYRHSSEILHGTFYGALFFFGLTAPSGEPRSPASCAEAVGQHHMLVLMSVVLSLFSCVEAFHRAYGFQAAFDDASRAYDELGAIAYFAENQVGS